MNKVNKIEKLIKSYKEEVEEYRELLEESLEDGETNSIWETYIETYSQFIKELEKLKEYD